jgi:hypothetical protein
MKAVTANICQSKKLCICGFDEVLSPQKITCPQIATFADGLQICGWSANLLICDLRNLFADHPPLSILNQEAVVKGTVA